MREGCATHLSKAHSQCIVPTTMLHFPVMGEDDRSHAIMPVALPFLEIKVQ